MWLHKQARPVLLEPATAVALAQLDEVHGPVIFVAPVVVLNAAYADIDEHHAARPQHGYHAAVRQSDISIAVTGIAIGEHALEAAPLLNHPGKQLGTLWIECRI